MTLSCTARGWHLCFRARDRGKLSRGKQCHGLTLLIAPSPGLLFGESEAGKTHTLLPHRPMWADPPG